MDDAEKQSPIDAIDWHEPEPLHAEYKSLDYPIDSLPEIIRDAVKEVHEHVQAPIAMTAVSAITNVSIACQGSIDIARDSRMSGPTSLYFLTVGDSGERKTACYKAFSGGITLYEQEMAERMSPEIKRYKADLETHKARCSGLLSEIRRLSTQGEPTSPKEEEYRRLAAKEPVRPRVPKFLIEDSTSEAIAHDMKHKWPAAAIVSDEGGKFFGGHAMNSDSIMRSLAALNSMWDGSTVRVSRRTSESFEVENPRLTFSTMIQKSTLNKFTDQTGDLARGTGLFARCLVSMPESTQGDRFYREPTEGTPALDAFNKRLREILDASSPLNERGQLEPVLMQLSPEAKAEWVQFFNNIEPKLKSGGELEELRDVASKTPDNAVRLAALFAFMETKSPAEPVSAENMRRAQAIALWHMNEARRFFSEAAVSEDQRNVARLNDWLVRRCIDNECKRVERRIIQQYGPSPCRDRDTRDWALGELERAGRVVLLREVKTDWVVLNPALLQEGES